MQQNSYPATQQPQPKPTNSVTELAEKCLYRSQSIETMRKIGSKVTRNRFGKNVKNQKKKIKSLNQKAVPE